MFSCVLLEMASACNCKIFPSILTFYTLYPHPLARRASSIVLFVCFLVFCFFFCFCFCNNILIDTVSGHLLMPLVFRCVYKIHRRKQQAICCHRRSYLSLIFVFTLAYYSLECIHESSFGVCLQSGKKINVLKNWDKNEKH